MSILFLCLATGCGFALSASAQVHQSWVVRDTTTNTYRPDSPQSWLTFAGAVTIKYVQGPWLVSAAMGSTGHLRSALLGEPGRSYTVQASANLVNWSAMTNFVSATGTNQFVDVAAPNFNRRFYRVLSP